MSKLKPKVQDYSQQLVLLIKEMDIFNPIYKGRSFVEVMRKSHFRQITKVKQSLN